MKKIEKEESQQRIRTKVKFMKSDKTNAYIGFVSKNPKSGRICGVRQESEYPKKIVIIDHRLSNLIVENVLYDIVAIPMKEKDGYIAIEATPVAFKAVIETTYVPKAIYKIEIKFGGKTVLFDPVGGKRDSVRTIAGVREVLENRMDIESLPKVIDDFNDAAYNLMKRYENDKLFRKRKL